MSSNITVPYQVMAEGYVIEGNRGGATQATVPYLVYWADAFTFYNQVLGYPSATAEGPITFYLAERFPPEPSLIANRATIRPIGNNYEHSTGSDFGLVPGQFFKYCIVTVTFEVLPYIQENDDDRLNQFDPNNPITLCEQSIQHGGKMVTLKSEGYEFDDGAAVTGDIAKLETESKLVFTFPKVPFLPWATVQTYLGCVNDRRILQCPTGTLLFESAASKFSATTTGLKGQMLTLEFAYQNFPWNQIPRPDGTLGYVRKKGDVFSGIYELKDLSQLFITTTLARQL